MVGIGFQECSHFSQGIVHARDPSLLLNDLENECHGLACVGIARTDENDKGIQSVGQITLTKSRGWLIPPTYGSSSPVSTQSVQANMAGLAKKNEVLVVTICGLVSRDGEHGRKSVAVLRCPLSASVTERIELRPTDFTDVICALRMRPGSFQAILVDSFNWFTLRWCSAF